MRRLLVALGLISLIFLMFGRRAGADTGATADPTGDVWHNGESGPGPLDITAVTHEDDGVRATYTITTAAGFTTSDVHALHIYLSEVEGFPAYDCHPAAVHVDQKDGALSGMVRQCLGSGGGQGLGTGGFKDLGVAAVDHSDGTNTLTVSFDLSALRDNGFTGPGYGYLVWLATPRSGADSVPDEGTIRHDFSPAPTPVPATPTPTAAPTPVPTEAPTAAIVEAVNPEPADQGASFAAPEEGHEDSGLPVPVPVAVAAGGLGLAGAGVALARFWPF